MWRFVMKVAVPSRSYTQNPVPGSTLGIAGAAESANEQRTLATQRTTSLLIPVMLGAPTYSADSSSAPSSTGSTSSAACTAAEVSLMLFIQM